MNTYIPKLHWKEKIEIVEQKIAEDKNFDYKDLILPKEGKDYWENCARIIVKLNDEEIVKLLPELLEWLKDLNWPGAILILNRLQKLPVFSIEKCVSETIEKAIIKKDMQWVEFLLYLNNIQTNEVVKILLKYIDGFEDDERNIIAEWLRKVPEQLQTEDIKKWL